MDSGLYNNYEYNKSLKPYANALRKNMTKAEACLWKYALKARGIKGYQFRRQRPVLQYIADFMCKELKLIIEVDGATHHFDETYTKDLQKQKNLENAGFKIIRFSDEDVLKNINNVIAKVENVINELEFSTPNPRQRGTV